MNKEFQDMLDKKLAMAKINEEPQKFTVTIEEHISQSFEVKANDIDEALEIAKAKYNEGIFVVGSDLCIPTARLMMAEDEYGAEATEWEEF